MRRSHQERPEFSCAEPVADYLSSIVDVKWPQDIPPRIRRDEGSQVEHVALFIQVSLKRIFRTGVGLLRPVIETGVCKRSIGDPYDLSVIVDRIRRTVTTSRECPDVGHCLAKIDEPVRGGAVYGFADHHSAIVDFPGNAFL